MALAGISGGSSGFDSEAIISVLLQIKQAPIDEVKKKITQVNAEKDKVSSVKSKLSALKSAAEAIDTLNEFYSFKTTSTDEDKLTVSSTGSASAGSYRVEVLQRAKESRFFSNSYTSSSDLVGAGTIDITGSPAAAVSLTIDASDTLSSVKDKINNSGANVTASIINDGSGGYRLVVAGKTTGASYDNAVSIVGTSLSVTKYQTAQDSQVRIDGRAELVVSSSSNQVTTAIPGVTLNLKTDTADVTVSVSADPDAVVTKVKSFVDAVNDVIKSVKTLEKDSMQRSAIDGIRTAIRSQIDSLTGTYTYPAEVGLMYKSDGTLELDSTKFKSSLSTDFNQVGKLFIDQSTTDGVAERIEDLVSRYTIGTGSGASATKGLIQLKQDTLDGKVKNYNQKIELLERQYDMYEKRIRLQYQKVDQALSAAASVKDYLG